MASEKRDLRRAMLTRRAEAEEHARLADDHARTALVLAHLPSNTAVVAAYLSEPTEPGTAELVATLHARGVRLLLPVSGREPSWGLYAGSGSVRVGRWGIPEPIGDPLGDGPLASTDVVIVPGLAGSPAGTRLGRGGGWYDRALLHASPTAPRILLLNDVEVVEDLPHEPHDLPVTAIATPTRWLDCPRPGDLAAVDRPMGTRR